MQVFNSKYKVLIYWWQTKHVLKLYTGPGECDWNLDSISMFWFYYVRKSAACVLLYEDFSCKKQV